jgi:hypothetical protein
VIHACNPSTWEAEEGVLQVGSQPGLESEKKKNQEMIEERGSGRIVFVHLAELPLWALGFI